MTHERARVSGATTFTADVPCPEALHAAFLLADQAHARIIEIDVREAVATQGVAAVVTGRDLGHRRFGRSLRDYPVLAVDRVLFPGQRVAAVAAADPDTARAAVRRVHVRYEALPPVPPVADGLNPEGDLDLDAALARPVENLHPEYAAYDGADPSRKSVGLQGSDELVGGDPQGGFESSDAVLRHTFAWTRSHAAPLETHACLVVAGDPLTRVYSTHKEPYALRRDLALVTGQPQEHFVIEPVPVGGDFGAKATPYLEAACYELSVRTGRPVRSVMSYGEELATTSARHGGRIQLTTGLAEGRLVAHRARALLDGLGLMAA